MHEEETLDEDFRDALALLHSGREDSAEQLRKMLDAGIERRHGFARTLTARMPRRFAQETGGKSFANERTETCEWQGGNSGRKAESVLDNDWKSALNVEDFDERGDIPTISIPDEGSGDGLLCKVSSESPSLNICNGAKLGPLILLECQECQEVYHPLCHQPPVVDVDVFDPRIVWRCKKCTDTAGVDEGKAGRCRNESGNIKEPSAKTERPWRSGGSFPESEEFLRDVAEKATSAAEEPPIPKTSFRLNQKSTRSAASSLRRRIGSKLSVSRSAAK